MHLTQAKIKIISFICKSQSTRISEKIINFEGKISRQTYLITLPKVDLKEALYFWAQINKEFNLINDVYLILSLKTF